MLKNKYQCDARNFNPENISNSCVSGGTQEQTDTQHSEEFTGPSNVYEATIVTETLEPYYNDNDYSDSLSNQEVVECSEVAEYIDVEPTYEIGTKYDTINIKNKTILQENNSVYEIKGPRNNNTKQIVKNTFYKDNVQNSEEYSNKPVCGAAVYIYDHSNDIGSSHNSHQKNTHFDKINIEEEEANYKDDHDSSSHPEIEDSLNNEPICSLNKDHCYIRNTKNEKFHPIYHRRGAIEKENITANNNKFYHIDSHKQQNNLVIKPEIKTIVKQTNINLKVGQLKTGMSIQQFKEYSGEAIICKKVNSTLNIKNKCNNTTGVCITLNKSQGSNIMKPNKYIEQFEKYLGQRSKNDVVKRGNKFNSTGVGTTLKKPQASNSKVMLLKPGKSKKQLKESSDEIIIYENNLVDSEECKHTKAINTLNKSLACGLKGLQFNSGITIKQFQESSQIIICRNDFMSTGNEFNPAGGSDTLSKPRASNIKVLLLKPGKSINEFEEYLGQICKNDFENVRVGDILHKMQPSNTKIYQLKQGKCMKQFEEYLDQMCKYDFVNSENDCDSTGVPDTPNKSQAICKKCSETPVKSSKGITDLDAQDPKRMVATTRDKAKVQHLNKYILNVRKNTVTMLPCSVPYMGIKQKSGYSVPDALNKSQANCKKVKKSFSGAPVKSSKDITDLNVQDSKRMVATTRDKAKVQHNNKYYLNVRKNTVSIPCSIPYVEKRKRRGYDYFKEVCDKHPDLAEFSDSELVRPGDAFESKAEFLEYVNARGPKWMFYFCIKSSKIRSSETRVEFACAFRKMATSSKGLRKRKKYRTNCPCRVVLVKYSYEDIFKVRHVCYHHDHELSPEMLAKLPVRRNLPEMKELKEEILDLASLDVDKSVLWKYMYEKTGRKYKSFFRQLVTYHILNVKNKKIQREFSTDKLKSLMHKIKEIYALYGPKDTDTKEGEPTTVSQKEISNEPLNIYKELLEVQQNKQAKERAAKIKLLENMNKPKRIRNRKTRQPTAPTENTTEETEECHKKRRLTASPENEDEVKDDEVLESVRSLQAYVGDENKPTSCDQWEQTDTQHSDDSASPDKVYGTTDVSDHMDVDDSNPIQIGDLTNNVNVLKKYSDYDSISHQIEKSLNDEPTHLSRQMQNQRNTAKKRVKIVFHENNPVDFEENKKDGQTNEDTFYDDDFVVSHENLIHTETMEPDTETEAKTTTPKRLKLISESFSNQIELDETVAKIHESNLITINEQINKVCRQGSSRSANEEIINRYNIDSFIVHTDVSKLIEKLSTSIGVSVMDILKNLYSGTAVLVIVTDVSNTKQLIYQPIRHTKNYRPSVINPESNITADALLQHHKQLCNNYAHTCSNLFNMVIDMQKEVKELKEKLNTRDT